jgi:CRISPR-associated protein Csb1
MSNITINQFDNYLAEDGPAALVIREYLTPVEGADAVFFPPTYAAGDGNGFPGGYNIDGDTNGENIALVDSVGSQANRIEPLFAEPPYDALVPQVIIKAGEKNISLLEAGHRAGDAIVRCSALKEELNAAFKKLNNGDYSALAEIAPTSLVFGVWDSRDTQAKTPRIISSTIRAYNVRKLTRSAQYNPAANYVKMELLSDSDNYTDSDGKKIFAKRGFDFNPATGVPGGIIAKGGIRRDASLALSALKLIKAGTDKTATLSLRRYILGLALVAFTRLPSGYLRQGTTLVSDTSKKTQNEFVKVQNDGKRIPIDKEVSHQIALEYAKQAKDEFFKHKEFRKLKLDFNKELAKEDFSPKNVENYKQLVKDVERAKQDVVNKTIIAAEAALEAKQIALKELREKAEVAAAAAKEIQKEAEKKIEKAKKAKAKAKIEKEVEKAKQEAEAAKQKLSSAEDDVGKAEEELRKAKNENDTSTPKATN